MNKKITELDEATEINKEDLLMIIQSGKNKKAQAGIILNKVNENAEKLTVVSPTEPTGDNREKVWIQKGKNILIPSNGSTAISSNDNNTYTFKSDLGIDWYGYIAIAKLKANTQYTISVSSNLLYGRLALSTIPEGTPDGYSADIIVETSNEDDALHLLSAENTITSATFTSNSDQLVYLRYCSDAERTNLSSFTVSIQLEQGSTATDYEPYIEKKIFVKNDNGVYEEFYNEKSIIKTQVYKAGFDNVGNSSETGVNVDFATMFSNLSLSDVICFNIEITNVHKTWDRTYANVLLDTGTLQIRSYAETQHIDVCVTAFYR